MSEMLRCVRGARFFFQEGMRKAPACSRRCAQRGTSVPMCGAIKNRRLREEAGGFGQQC
ncbi:hypothetical protein [Pseudoduganella buxea]|uniref:Uncharacterized protein n=1 Tax=Pseudoduganella buxea TaxID=1949069 RepID=A0A6I3SRJ2_9BURK|nr:hypothetical protein [Pseudoduganella buxea]MTV51718.1 hypothetical protein [Pseudoduganella buxea]